MRLKYIAFFVLFFMIFWQPGVDAQIVEDWIARYDGPANLREWAGSIFVDAVGNVYVTGGSDGIATNRDVTTIKYDNNGILQWVSRYNGPANGWDSGFDISVDSAGNVYVAGTSTGGAATEEDYVTIKYDVDGSELWVKRYNGPDSQDDNVSAMALDSAGNVYVTGFCNGIADDYCTIKYDTDGNQIWLNQYNGAGARNDHATDIEIDSYGSVYVTGYCDTGISRDYTTIKYFGDGSLHWISRYHGSDEDEATAMALDSSGNTYVTGSSWGGFDPRLDYATVKYDRFGAEQWVARYNGPGPLGNRYDEATAIAVDISGNVYVTGFSEGPTANDDFATIKYNEDGIEQWVARYDGPGKKDDQATAIALDALGNVYVTGTSYASSTYIDYTTIKYNNDGVEQWVMRYNGTGNENDKATDIAVDTLGNVYITGCSFGSGTNNDYVTIKYSERGLPAQSGIIWLFLVFFIILPFYCHRSI